VAGGVETESKHRVADTAAVTATLVQLGFRAGPIMLESDEYYDTAAGLLRAGDMVVRLRLVQERVTACFKGPRTYLPDGSYSRLEVELPAAGIGEVRAAFSAQGLVCVWRLQKRRRQYRHPDRLVVVCADEVPELGHFVELEGEPADIADVRRALGWHIGPPERLNYRELAGQWLAGQGSPAPAVLAFPGNES
jgi:predicted adenylyl cyclase CyaB